jgi:hypothetical protein
VLRPTPKRHKAHCVDVGHCIARNRFGIRAAGILLHTFVQQLRRNTRFRTAENEFTVWPSTGVSPHPPQASQLVSELPAHTGPCRLCVTNHDHRWLHSNRECPLLRRADDPPASPAPDGPSRLLQRIPDLQQSRRAISRYPLFEVPAIETTSPKSHHSILVTTCDKIGRRT